jgi:CRISPR-associated protein Csb2
MLAIEVEFLTGVSVAATPYRREEAEWPPHPDRLFQALVAAWGRNEEPLEDERAALEWLESLDMDELLVSAAPARPRDVAQVYVPPNDARTRGDLAKSVQVIPSLRTNRQPRAFPTVIPDGVRPAVRYLWRRADGLAQHRAALARLAAEVTYIGHSHTLVRVALPEGDFGDDDCDHAWIGADRASLRVPHAGRLAHLVDRYQNRTRPHPSLALRQFARPPVRQVPHTCFDPDTAIVLADDGGFVPALDAFPLVAKRIRDALLQTAEENGLRIPALLSGHDPDGSAVEAPHLAILPLADVGWEHSRGRLMGLALIWPRAAVDDDLSAALEAFAAFLEDGRGTIHFGRAGSWRVMLEPASERASLRIRRYAGVSRRWGTVLPLVLDRHPKAKPGKDVGVVIAQACVNAGLPQQAVERLAVELHMYSPIRGAPSVRAVADALAEDSPYRGRPMRHVVLTFAEPIAGPLILGAGRYRGLGLCLPLKEGAEP